MSKQLGVTLCGVLMRALTVGLRSIAYVVAVLKLDGIVEYFNGNFWLKGLPDNSNQRLNGLYNTLHGTVAKLLQPV